MPITRAYSGMPPEEELLKIEGPVIIEEAAGGGIVGARVGVVAVIGETLKGTPNVPIEITNPSDILAIFGGFNKYIGDGAAYKYDGNAYVGVAGLSFSKLVMVSVDDRVGLVDLARTAPGFASVESTNLGPFALADNDTFIVAKNGPVTLATLTIQATAASNECAVAGNWNLSAAGAATLTMQVNGGPLQTFTMVEGVDAVALAAVTPAELNTWLNIKFAAISSALTSGATKATVTTDRKGLSASLLFGGGMRSIVGFSAALVQSSQLAADNTVQDVDAVTTDEMVDLLNALLDQAQATASNVSGKLKVARTIQGIAETLTISGLIPGIDPAGKIKFATTLGPVTGGTGTAPAATMNAGTRISDGGANIFLLAEDVSWAEDEFAKTDVAIKQASGGAVLAAAVDTFVDTPSASDFPGATVTNPLATTAKPASESGWLTKYQAALDALKAAKSPSSEVNLLVVTRHGVAGVAVSALTGSLPKAVTDHCIDMTSKGRPRIAITSPPLATTKTIARSSSGVGVGSTTAGGRHKRRVFAYPGVQKRVQEITIDDAALDGIVDWPFDVMVASKASMLAPELSLSEADDTLRAMLGLESYFTETGVGGALTDDDYVAHKAAGIASPRIDEVNGPIIQSQVTTVNPTTDPADVAISDRRSRDWIHVSLVNGVARKQSKLNTPSRRRAVIADIYAYLQGLKDAERIADFAVKEATPDSLKGKGVLVILVAVRLLDHLDNIVFRFNIGRTVDVEAVS